MASSSLTFRPQQQTHFFSFTLCKYSPTLNSFKFLYSSNTHMFSPIKPTLHSKCSPLLEVRAQVTTTTHLETNLSRTQQELSRNTTNQRNSGETGSGVSSFRPREKKLDKNSGRSNVNLVVEEKTGKRVIQDGYGKKRFAFNKRRGNGYGLSSMRSENQNLSKNTRENKGNKFTEKKNKGDKAVSEKIGKKPKNCDVNQLVVVKLGKGPKKNKADSPSGVLRIGLDMCSKRGDVMGAIRLYDVGKREGIKMGLYHYAVLLYLCSSAATGVVQPAKSGSGTRSLSTVDSSKSSSVDFHKSVELDVRNFDSDQSNLLVLNDGMSIEYDGTWDTEDMKRNSFPVEVAKNDSHRSYNGQKNSIQFSNGSLHMCPHSLNELIELIKGDNGSSNAKMVNGEQEKNGIQVSEEVKRYALQRGFEIHEKMQLENVPPSEATLTSVARMAMSMGDGEMAFDMVKEMKALGINPRLRSYGPALSVFCNSGDVDKAFTVEEHMLEHGVYPEEPELEVLLRVSVEAGRSDKVYYLLHKLRTTTRQVSPHTADLIEKWFNSKTASRVGKKKWDKKLIIEMIKNRGGGWHGHGWLGKGKWIVSRTSVGAEGLCSCCGENLATIDLDPVATAKFAASVAAIAAQREENSSFQTFQKWLDYYGPFEAVVDGANVGLFSQRRLKPSKINAVVNGIRQMLPSKKWPLIVLHNRRITGGKMDEPVNKAVVEKWKTADALYATPTGSNDDWYWLYAAIKFKCLIVTNDEMRDHLFQLLGNDFFPMWKERHQVRFRFTDVGPEFYMPPPCSVVIQESEKGHWHIPIVSEQDSEGERTWLCITRAKSHHEARPDFATTDEEPQSSRSMKGYSSSGTKTWVKLPPLSHGSTETTEHQPQDLYRNVRDILSSSTFESHQTILKEIEAAERRGLCVIDFQI